jgi:hypothetical protein
MSSIHFTPSPLPRRAWWTLGLAAAALFATITIAAQQPQPAAGSAPAPAAKKSPRHHSRPAAAPPAAEQPAPTPQPEMPKWPVNDAPAKPSITWDSQGLRIDANNSSLHEILNEVSADTGAKVEGMGSDERVFGQYGPGAARDVISQLLHGSSYNVLMIGDQGSGTPRQIVLSARHSGPNPPDANRPPQEQPDEDIPDEPQSEDQPVQPPLINGRPPMPMVPQGPPGAPRTPQQVLQELQQRQQQIQDQQQQQQQQQQQPH